MSEEKNKGGRPKKYINVEDMQKDIDRYFNSCFKPIVKYNKVKAKFETIKDDDGNPVLEQFKPFTVTGLADALDMSRQSLLNYSENEMFFDTIMRAKRLFDKDGANGAKFSLANNFKNWKDKKDVDTNIKGNVSIEQYLKKVDGDEY